MGARIERHRPRRMEVTAPRSALAPNTPRRESPRRKRRKSRRTSVLVTLLLAGILASAGSDAYIFLRYIAPGMTSFAAATPAPAAAATGSSQAALDTASRPECKIPPQKPRMMTPAELAHPTVTGNLDTKDGVIGKCVRSGLAIPPAPGGAPRVGGQVILVSLSQQWLWAYLDRHLVFANPVTTGREFLGTPQGTYAVSQKVSDTWFYSPWPPGSPYYYSPEHVNYAMYFRHGGYYIHDAPWRHAFGPGTNVPHVSPDGTHEDGSHGCVNVATTAGKWLFDWMRIGATVIIAD